eukprot:3793124-Pyramimonas_sp.AAC.1
MRENGKTMGHALCYKCAVLERSFGHSGPSWILGRLGSWALGLGASWGLLGSWGFVGPPWISEAL